MAGIATMRQLLELVAADEFGVARLTQALECVHQSLVSIDGLRDFLDDLHKHWASSGEHWAVAWDKVARGEVANRHGARGHVRRTLPGSDWPPCYGELSTVVDETVWRDWHLVKNVEQLTDAGLPIPSFPIGRNPVAAEEFAMLTANPGWSAPSRPEDGAWLGRPSRKNANCWVSSAHLAPAELGEPNFANAQQAMAARGLVSNPNMAAVRYVIEPRELTAAGATEPAHGCRPGLADCGSVWFRVVSEGVAAQRHRRHGWGSTVNLDCLHDPATSDTGLPERVMASLPVHSSAVKRVELLPAAEPSPGRRPPDQRRFVKRLKSGRTAAEIVAAMLHAVHGDSSSKEASA